MAFNFLKYFFLFQDELKQKGEVYKCSYLYSLLGILLKLINPFFFLLKPKVSHLVEFETTTSE